MCPEGYCHICSVKDDARVDLLEMKSYNQIDLDETPIVVLGCGHFFTAETLGGHVGMGEVYEIDGYGEFTGLKDTAELARAIPRCPDCQCPVRQHAIHLYNRVVNRAVIDEMSKRFLVGGRDELRALEQRIEELEVDLEKTHADIIHSIQQPPSVRGGLSAMRALKINKELDKRYDKSKGLQKAIRSFCERIDDKHKPAQKLHNATIHAMRRKLLGQLVSDLAITGSIPAIPRDRQITIEVKWRD
jgi:hypothetical protein